MEPGTGGRDRRREQIGNMQGNIFGRGHTGGKEGHVLVEEGVVKRLHHQIVHQLLEDSQIADHPGTGIDRTAHGHIEQVVVAMAMGAGALAVDRLVVRLGQLGPRQAMGGGEMGADREEGFHGIGQHIGPEVGGFKQAQAHQGQLGGQAAPDRQAKGLGGGQASLGEGEVKVGPGLVEKPEIQLGRHL